MSKNSSTGNRVNLGFSLIIVFLLVLATNRVDKRHFETVQNTLTSLHEDRVIAQDYVYKMGGVVHKKRIILIDSSSVENKIELNKQFEILIDVFSTTKLTRKEAKTFNRLQEDFDKLKDAEQQNAQSNGKFSKVESDYLSALETDLDNLAFIQMSESKNLISIAQKTLDSNNLISNLEIGFLILIGIILQFVIFYRVKKDDTKIEEE